MSCRRHIFCRFMAVIVAVASGHTHLMPSSTRAEDLNQQYYIVQSGDTLTSIVRRFYGQDDASKMRNIFQANRPTLESPDKIYVGQRLVLPGLSLPAEQEDKAVSTEVQVSPDPACVVKVMTFNIRRRTAVWDRLNRWNKRRHIVFDTFRRSDADVIGLQEALYSQIRQIQHALPQYSGYAVGRSDGMQRGESCAIFYRKDRFEVIDYGTFWFSDTPDKPGSTDWGNLLPRMCSWVQLGDKRSHTAFYVYNLHLDNLSQNSRSRSMHLLASRVRTRKSQDPFIVMGDFNMELDNPAMLYLQNNRYQTLYPRMVDAWQSVHSTEADTGTYHRFKGRTSGPQIDHIAVSEQVQALDADIDRYEIDGHYPSDHFPVTATVRVSTKKPASPYDAGQGELIKSVAMGLRRK